MTTKEQILCLIQTTDNEIAALENDLKSLQNKKKELQKELKSVVIQESTERFLDRVYNLSGQNSLHVSIRRSTKTTPIFDDFYGSDKEYLVIDTRIRIYRTETRAIEYMHLIIAKAEDEILYDQSHLTMTDLKNILVSRTYIDSVMLENLPESSRESSLYHELLNSRADKNGIIRFQRPVVLNAQTYSNQTGYGWEWSGNSCIRGTEYGETTKFFIIGAIAEN